MKAETADTIYRELLRRSSADGLAYLREQLAAHEAKGYGLAVRDAAGKPLPAALAGVVAIGRAAARALRGETGE